MPVDGPGVSFVEPVLCKKVNAVSPNGDGVVLSGTPCETSVAATNTSNVTLTGTPADFTDQVTVDGDVFNLNVAVNCTTIDLKVLY